MPSHPLTSFEIQQHHQNKSKFNGIYSRHNLPKLKDGTYVINRDVYESIETHQIALLNSFVKKIKQPILTALEFNIFQKKI